MRNCFIDIEGGTRARPNIDNERVPPKDGDGCQVRRTSGESFLPPTSSQNLQDGHQEADIGDHEDQATEYSYSFSQDQKH